MKFLKYAGLALIISSCSIQKNPITNAKPQFKEIPHLVVDNKSNETNITHLSLEEGIQEIRKFSSKHIQEDAHMYYNNTWEDVGHSPEINNSTDLDSNEYELLSKIFTKKARIKKIFKLEKDVKLFHFHPNKDMLLNYYSSIKQQENLQHMKNEETAIPSNMDIIGMSHRAQRHAKYHPDGSYEEGIMSDYGVVYISLTQKGKEKAWDKLSNLEFNNIGATYGMMLHILPQEKIKGDYGIRRCINMLSNEYYNARFVPFEK